MKRFVRRRAAIVVGAGVPAEARGRHPRTCSRAGSTRPARSSCSRSAALRRAGIQLRPALRLHGPAVVRPRALLRSRRVRRGDRDDPMALGLLGVDRLHRARRAPARGRARRRVAAGQRHRLRDGHPGVRAGGLDPRAQEPVRLDRRRGRLRRRLPQAALRGPSASSTRSTSTGSRSAYAAAVFAIVRWAVNSSPGHVWQAIRENELRVQVLGLKPYTYKLMSYVLASLLATLGGVVYLLLLGGANTDVTTRELHADAAPDGRDRRHRLALGRVDRRHPLHVSRTTGSAISRRRMRCRRCPRSCGFRCSSRCSSSVCCSSWSCSSFPAGSTRIGQAVSGWTGPAPAGIERRRYEDQVGVAGRRPAAAADSGARVHAARAGSRSCAGSRAGTGWSRSTTAASASPTSRRGPTRPRRWPRDALQVLDEAGVERAHVLGASLGGMIAQELAVAAPRAGRQARALLHDAGRRRRRPDARADPAAVRRGAVAGARGGAPALRRERARRRIRRPSSSTRSSPAASRTRPIPPAGQAQAAAGAGMPGRRSAIARTDARSSPARPTTSSTHRNAELLAARIPDARVELIEGAGHMFFWEQPDESVRIIDEFLE